MAKNWVSYLSCLTPIPSCVWAWANKSATLAWELHFPEQHLALFTLFGLFRPASCIIPPDRDFSVCCCEGIKKSLCICVQWLFWALCLKAVHSRTLNCMKELGKILLRTVFWCIGFMTINEAITDCSIICCAQLLSHCSQCQQQMFKNNINPISVMTR